MLHRIDGIDVYVVEFKTIPELPITPGADPELWPYADALSQAIQTNVITEGGKYGIHVVMTSPLSFDWKVFNIHE